MKNLVLSVMDWDHTWVGLRHLRPSPEEFFSSQVNLKITLITSMITMIISGVLGLLLLRLLGFEAHTALSVATLISVVGGILNAILQLVSVVFWNKRAKQLQGISRQS